MRRPLPLMIGLLFLTVAFHGAAADPIPGPVTPPAETLVRGWDDRYIVPLDAVSVAALEAALAHAGGELVRIDERLDFAVVMIEAPAALARLLGVPLEPDVGGAGALRPNDPLLTQQWALGALVMADAWDLQRGSRTVRVAVIDSGVDMRHTDLAGTAFITGFDYIGRDLDPSDVHGHGTHVAGTIAAGIGNGIGISGMADVTLIVNRVLDHRNLGSCADFASAVAEAVALGADIINLSLYCDSAAVQLTAAVRLADEAGVIVVAAAGNFWAGRPHACVTFPASVASVIAVAALESDLTAAGYSCRGPPVELSAPGSDVLSTLPGNRYGSWSGTSMAAPHVAAVAALLLSHADLSADEVRGVLQATAQDLGDPGRDVTYGYGLIQPVAALRSVA